MTGRKYSRIIQSARYYAAVDNYIKYITDATKKGQNVGQGKARPASVKLYVVPFAINLVENQFAVVSAALPAWNAYKADVGATRTKETLAATQEAVDIDNFRPARVIVKTGILATGAVKTSAVTGMKYLSYGGDSTSVPFGKNAAELESDAFTAIRNAIAAKLNPASSRVTWSKEKV